MDDPNKDLRESLDALGDALGKCRFACRTDPGDPGEHRCVLDAGHSGPHDLECYAYGPDRLRYVEQEEDNP